MGRFPDDRHARRHGGSQRRLRHDLPEPWRDRVHGARSTPGIDEQTLDVQAVEITGSHIGAAPALIDLLRQIPVDENTASVTAEGTCDTRKFRDATAGRRTQAVVRPRRNANLKADHCWCGGRQRGSAGVGVARPSDLAKPEGISRTKPRQSKDSGEVAQAPDGRGSQDWTEGAAFHGSVRG